MVSGTPQVGQTLTAGGDTWQKADTLSVQWQRRPAGGSWTDVAGAIARTYAIPAADQGAELRVVIEAVNPDGETTATSPARGPVTAAPTTTPPATNDGTSHLHRDRAADDRGRIHVRRPRAHRPRRGPAARQGQEGGQARLHPQRRPPPRSSAKGLKARNGRYTLRVCAGTKCVTRKVKVAKGKIKLTKLTLPATKGTLEGHAEARARDRAQRAPGALASESANHSRSSVHQPSSSRPAAA